MNCKNSRYKISSCLIEDTICSRMFMFTVDSERFASEKKERADMPKKMS